MTTPVIPSLARELKRFREWISRRNAGLAVLGVLATMLAIYMLVATRPSPNAASARLGERTWPVEIVEARRQDVKPTLRLFGEVVAGRYSELRALVPGLVMATGPSFREGALVRRGDLLLRIDPFEYETTLRQRQALLDEARTSLDLLRLKHQRTETLFRKGTLSRQALDEAFLLMKQQESVVAQAEIGVERAERAVAETRLLAPFDGVLTNVNANMGKEVNSNDRVADLVDIQDLEVKFTLSNAQFGGLLQDGEQIIGRPAKIYWQAGNENRQFDARVERTDARVTSNAGGISTYAVILSKDAAGVLRPGAFVRVELEDKVYRDVIRAPDSALYGKETVYVVNSEGRVEHRTVTIVGQDDDDVLIRSAGSPPVREGERIIVTQLREAGVGARVDIRQ